MTTDPRTLLVLTGAFAAAVALAALATPALRAWCERLELTAPGRPARLGGLALALAFALPIAVVLGHDLLPGAVDGGLRLLGLGAAAATILALGAWDDLRGATALEKLVVQVVVAVATWALGVRVDAFTALDGTTIQLAAWMSLPLTTLWIVGVTNAVNLIDGLDGLAAGVCLIAVSTLFAFGWMDGHALLCLVCVALAGSLVGFLFYNFNPARIFMGDSGSLTLGYVLAVVSVLSTTKQYTAWALALPVLALGLPLFDTALAVLRRLRRGRPVTAPDQDHVHHRLMRAGYSHRQAVLLLYGVCVALAAVAWTLRATHDISQAAWMAAAACAVFVIIHAVGLPRLAARRRTASAQHERHRHVLQRRVLARTIRGSDTLDALWMNALRALVANGAVEVHLELYTRCPTLWRYNHRRRHRPVEVVVPLLDENHSYGELRVARRRTHDPEQDQRRDINIHLVAESITDALDALIPTLRRDLVVTRLPVR